MTSAGAGDWRLADVRMMNNKQRTEDLLRRIEGIHGSLYVGRGPVLH
jgi:hypothetical protein